MEFILNEKPAQSDIDSVRERLKQHNIRYLETTDERQYVIEAKNDSGELAGGIVFKTWGLWLTIDFLWVDESERGRDLGTRLLKKAEDIGKEGGCRYSYLTTFSFQARPFYEKHGYEVVYTQKNFPIENAKYHMEKSL